MKQSDKKKIVELLQVYIKQKGSQNKAANSLKGVSSAVISHLINGNWEPYSNEMFRNIGNQLGFNSKDWVFVETTNSKKILDTLKKVKVQQSVLTILGNSGYGKTCTSNHFNEHADNVIQIECASYWDEKFFLQEILTKMGVKNPYNRVPQMMAEIIKRVNNSDVPPIFLFGEVDKLKDPLLYFLITFYNELFGKCGIVLIATYYFKKRIEDGLRNRKKGYEEIASRFANYVELEETTALDVKKVCEAQGVFDGAAIKIIQRTAGGDLRRASELIRIYKLENGL